LTPEERNALVIILAAGVLAPLLSDRLANWVRLPGIVLEIALGILIGPHVLGWVHTNHVIDVFATIGLLFLFFIAGFEINFKGIRGRPVSLAIAGWFVSVALALAIGKTLESSGLIISAVLVALAMTTTAVGSLLPMLRDANEMETPLGRFVVAAGAIGEFGPIILMAFLLQTGSVAKTGSLIALFAALAIATGWFASREHPPALIDVFRRMMHTSAQLPLRTVALLLGLVVLITADLGLDTVLGAVTAGVVVSLAVKSDREELVHKLDGVSFGFFIPIFFVVSGIRFDLSALIANPETILRVPLFLALFLVVRGLPAIVLYRKDLPLRERLAVALMCSTELPLVVAITTIGVTRGLMHPENAAALVGAGMLSVLLFPALAFGIAARRAGKELRQVS